MDIVIIIVGKILSFFTRLLGGGTNLPGQLALKARPHILSLLAAGQKVIVVTGTNGKTTTCAITTSILKAAGCRVVTNESGANMKAGIVSCLIRAYRIFGENEGTYAVLEVDEAYLRMVTAELKPEIIAVTNIFRDQLDRFGEVSKTLAFIKEGSEKSKDSIFILNADEPHLCDFIDGAKKYYYGFRCKPSLSAAAQINAESIFCRKCSEPYEYKFHTFNHLGDYNCPVCGKGRPKISLGVDEAPSLTADASEVSFDGHKITIPQPGAYNIYNALCAAAIAGAIGVCPDDIRSGVQNQGSKFGRQETVYVDGREVRIILVKNPSGCDEAINSVLPDEENVNLGFLLNDNWADGTDISWIYDVHFEKLARMNYQNILIGGLRCYDMAIRLKCAGLNQSRFYICEDFDSLLYSIKTNTTGRVYLFTTYTAMIGFRKYLRKKRYIKKLWY